MQAMRISVITALVVVLAGCAAPPQHDRARGADARYETVAGESRQAATLDFLQRKNARALALMEAGRFGEAEGVLKELLSADVTHGPAHNNLGKVYFHQGDLYRAAREFQYAAKLMPAAPEPLNNLGLMLEAAGKLDEAAESYAKAVELDPDEPEFVGNLARAKVRRGDDDEEVRGLLEKLVLRDARPQWAEWARRTLSRLQPDDGGVDDPVESAGER